MPAILHPILPDNSPRIHLHLRRPWTRETYFEDQYYYEIYYKSCFPRICKRHRLRRPVYSSPCPGRMYTDLPSSNFSDSDLYWVQSPRRTPFTSRSATPDLMAADMDRGRRRGLWHSLFRSDTFDVFRMKRGTRLRHEHIERSRSKLPPRQYTYTRIDETDYGDEPWTCPRIGTPRRAPTPPRPRRFRWRVRSRSPERHARHHWDDLPRGDTGRPQQQPRARPTRPASPIHERGPSRRGQYTPSAPSQRAGPSRQTVTIIQRNPRETAPRSTTTASASRATDVDIITHDSVRERINRNRFHSLPFPPLRLRKVRFREGHEEFDHPVYSSSESDSDSDSSSDSSSGSSSESESESGLDGASEPSPTGSFVRSRHQPPVVVRQPRGDSPVEIVERRPGAGGVQAGDVLRGSMRGRRRERVGSEGVMYVYREPRGQGRGGDLGRWI